jgi:THO complex subunit 3
VRTISFSHDGVLLASASEDMKIDIGHVDTTEKVAEIPVDSPTFTVSWHPSRSGHPHALTANEYFLTSVRA